MPDSPSELASLRAELAKIERGFEARLSALQGAIERLEARASAPEPLRSTARVAPLQVENYQPESDPVPTPVPVVQSQPLVAEKDLTIAIEDQPAEEPRSSILRKTAAALVTATGPVGALVERAMSAYYHYRDQGKAPAFLMTLAGLVALTAGFGYLLQYSFNNFLGPVAKLGLGALIGVAIIGGEL